MKRVIRNAVFIIPLLFGFLLVITMFDSCEKPNKCGDASPGETEAYKNGENWQAECISLLDNSDSQYVYLYMHRYNDFRELREEIIIRKIKISDGIYKIVNGWGVVDVTEYSSHYGSHTADGDLVDGVYHVLESDSNYIEITTIDLNTCDFIGRYNITFLKDTVNTINQDLPDTIRFRDGTFKTKIQSR